MTDTIIYFIRHGLVENPQNTFYGRLPRYKLSQTGQKQVQAILPYFIGKTISRIFSSPLLRTRQTAGIIRSVLPGAEFTTTELLNEVKSPYDGVPLHVLDQKNWDIYTGIPRSYEKPADIFARAIKFCNRTIRQHHGESVIAVTHADVIIFLTLWVAGYDANFESKSRIERKEIEIPFPAPASISRFSWGEHQTKPGYEYFAAGLDE